MNKKTNTRGMEDSGSTLGAEPHMSLEEQIQQAVDGTGSAIANHNLDTLAHPSLRTSISGKENIGVAAAAIGTHNSDDEAHSDIRASVSGKEATGVAATLVSNHNGDGEAHAAIRALIGAVNITDLMVNRSEPYPRVFRSSIGTHKAGDLLRALMGADELMLTFIDDSGTEDLYIDNMQLSTSQSLSVYNSHYTGETSVMGYQLFIFTSPTHLISLSGYVS